MPFLYYVEHVGFNGLVINHFASEQLEQCLFGYVVLCWAETSGGEYEVGFGESVGNGGFNVVAVVGHCSHAFDFPTERVEVACNPA